jgi:hypothetical protein
MLAPCRFERILALHLATLNNASFVANMLPKGQQWHARCSQIAR